MGGMAPSGMTARAWWLFAAVSVLWGIPYLFIKLAVEDISPIWVAFGRIVVAFAVLLPYAGTRARCAGSASTGSRCWSTRSSRSACRGR